MDKNKLISRYFTNALSVEDQNTFDHLLETDIEFANEVAIQKDIKEAVRIEEHSIIKKKLQAFETKEKQLSPNYKIWLVAASVVILLGISGTWVFNSRTADSHQLYANYFEPYRNVVYPIVRGEVDSSLKAKAFRAYEQKKYDKALDYFNQLLESEEDGTIAFYKANVLLQLGETDEAITIFSQKSNTSEALKPKTHWYLALAYLKQNKLDQAKHELHQLRNQNDTFKAKEIQELLKKLK